MASTFSRAMTRAALVAAAVSLVGAMAVPAPAVAAGSDAGSAASSAASSAAASAAPSTVALAAAPAPDPLVADPLLATACPQDGLRRYVFTDVAAWRTHAVAIDCAAWWGVVGGRSPSQFAPFEAVTRGQAATMLAQIVRLANLLPEPGAHPGFSDTAGHVHEDGIVLLASVGVVTGVDGARFAPHAPVTRAQMATMLVRLNERVFAHDLGRGLGTDVDEDVGHDVGPAAGGFLDTVGSVHADAIVKLTASGIAAGVSPTRFDPDGHVTRAQMATFTMRQAGVQVRAGTLAHPPAAEGFLAGLGAVLGSAASQQTVPVGLNPSLTSAGEQLPAIYDDGCVTTETTSPACIYGDTSADRTIVLLGDSHAAHWFPPVDDLARARGWRLVVLAKGGCPVLDIAVYRDGRRADSCHQWREHALDRIEAARPERILLSNASFYGAFTPDGQPRPGEQRTNLIDGQAAITAALARRAPNAELTILGASPRLDFAAPECLADNLDDIRVCTRTRDQVVDTDLIAAQHAQATRDRADFIDTTALLCTDTTCPLIIGDLLIYWDTHHLTTPTSNWLRPAFHHAIPR